MSSELTDSTKSDLTKIYIQGYSYDEIAMLKLRDNYTFEFEDMRNESCWVWYTVFGKWYAHHDTLILSPDREVNSFVELQNRKFIQRHDSLISLNARQKNPYINWGNFKLSAEH